MENPHYMAKAPKAVVEKAQQELQAKTEHLQLLQQQQLRIQQHMLLVIYLGQLSLLQPVLILQVVM